MDATALTDEFGKRAYDIEKSIKELRDEFAVKLEEAKNNEIIVAIRSLGTRLSAIEERLPPPEEE